MRLRGEQEHFRAQCRDGGFWCFPVEQLATFVATWTAGKAFYHGLDLWGDPTWVKLADIVGVCHRTPEGFAVLAEEAEEQKRRELLEGHAE